jgi:3-dehydroquinate dehydratase-1
MQRLELLRELVKHKPALIDVELATLKKNDELADFLDASGARVLVSWHDFDATPPLERLEAILDEMTLFSNYVKVVTMARTIEDSLRILNLYDTPRASYAIIFAMGEPGAISRVLCTIIGNAPFTYASLESPTAPGQISLSAMRKLYNSLKHNKKIV